MLDADEIVRSADTGGKQLRKDAVWGIELVFTSLPSENEDIIKYFDDCTSWAEAEFNVPILSSVIHLDQGHPHCHVLLIPLFKGVLTAKKVYGNKSVMVARLDSFYEVVGRKYGLRRRRSRVKLASAQRKGLLQRCADFLSEGRWLTGKQIETILKPFREDPLPLAESLGVVFGGARSQVKFASMFGQGTPFVA
ncbi:hypothetical protein DIR46_12835 [Massilia oculi]|uniref:Plasmid recombination enzyme n=2 Tax=Massilia oculi TaxID=945844 RepID=A0A2S2DIK1_9BURK|nr:plasmid recombination protein [Massilia oculi]AWL05223.1 hypothetical protein DIR46_12835 [Massilia oculi]